MGKKIYLLIERFYKDNEFLFYTVAATILFVAALLLILFGISVVWWLFL